MPRRLHRTAGALASARPGLGPKTNIGNCDQSEDQPFA